MDERNDVRVDTLNKRMAAISREHSSAERTLQELVKEATVVAGKVHAAKLKLSDLGVKLERNRMARVVALGISKSLDALRQKVIALQTEATRDDITVGRDKELCTQLVPAALAQLQAACPHPLIICRIGSMGSYSYDFEDQYPGHRRCVVCLVEEHSTSCAKEEYKILSERDDRVFEHAVSWSNPIDLKPLEEWQNVFIAQWRLYKELGLPEKK